MLKIIINMDFQTYFETGIREGESFRIDYLRQRIKALTGLFPKLKCLQRSSVFFLREIYFCFRKDGQAYDCREDEATPNNIGCGSGIVNLSIYNPRLGL